MSLKNIHLIFLRELRDQLRDKRTLFTVAVLPVLLYPMMGMVVLQVSQFTHEESTRVWVIGDEQLDEKPPLLAEKPGSGDPSPGELIIKHGKNHRPRGETFEEIEAEAAQAIEDGLYDAVVYFPPGFADELAEFRSRFLKRNQVREWDEDDQLPKLHIFYSGANDRSRIAHARLDGELHSWRYDVVTEPLKVNIADKRPAEPFEVAGADISKEEAREAVIWAKILPFVLMVWALTGAFYPAVDLCAGEKERGTLETLLTSPALRKEIVWGKLLAISSFSATTSLLNLISMGATGTFVMSRLSALGGGGMNSLAIGPPPLASIFWLLIALLPASIMFSALALSIATMARSTKEGQYYLLPLLMISMPLMVLAMLPSTSLSLGTSLVPVTGLMLWLRKLVEGQYLEAARYFVPVAAVTAVCVLVSIRWATSQFNKEEVLFRESERFSLKLWLVSMVRDRQLTPTVAAALFGAALLMVLRFFGMFIFEPPETFGGFAFTTVANLVLLIALPAVVMTFLFARSTKETLLLKSPPNLSILAAAALAVLLNPLVHLLAGLVQQVFPVGEQTASQLAQFEKLFNQAPGLWALVLVLALTPAICEEIAFRGFILSGLKKLGSQWEAVLLSSIFFGVAHGMIQQSLMATVTGVVLGVIAIQTGSLLPCVVYHLVHNSMAVLISSLDPTAVNDSPWLSQLVEINTEGVQLHWAVTVISTIGAAMLLWWFARLKPTASQPDALLRDEAGAETNLLGRPAG